MAKSLPSPKTNNYNDNNNRKQVQSTQATARTFLLRLDLGREAGWTGTRCFFARFFLGSTSSAIAWTCSSKNLLRAIRSRVASRWFLRTSLEACCSSRSTCPRTYNSWNVTVPLLCHVSFSSPRSRLDSACWRGFLLLDLFSGGSGMRPCVLAYFWHTIRGLARAPKGVNTAEEGSFSS